MPKRLRAPARLDIACRICRRAQTFTARTPAATIAAAVDAGWTPTETETQYDASRLLALCRDCARPHSAARLDGR